MIKALYLYPNPETEALLRESSASVVFPYVACQQIDDARLLLAQDPRISILLISDSITTVEAHQLSDLLFQRGLPVEVVLVTSSTQPHAPLIPFLDRKRLTPWLINERLEPSSLRSILDHVSATAQARMRLHETRINLLRHAGFLGTSPPLRHLGERVLDACDADGPVLIHGPQGSGHAALARTIHQCSSRHREGVFRAVGEQLLGDPVLPHLVFGRQTEPHQGRGWNQGIVDDVHRGVLYIPDIEFTVPEFQARLLDFIVNRRVNRGSTGSHSVFETRVIASSSRDLVSLARGGAFHPGLLNALLANPIEIPPLTDYTSDIPAIVESTAQRIWLMYRHDHSFPGFLPEASSILAATEWHGEREGLCGFVEYFMLIRGVDADEAIGPSQISGELANWQEAPAAGVYRQADLTSFHAIRRNNMNLDHAMNEARYGFFSILRRSNSNKSLATWLGKSSRWVELTIKELAEWYLSRNLRQPAELKRDKIWNRGFDKHGRT